MMSRIIFQDSYAVVVPSYSGTDLHKHVMLHLFLSDETLRLEIENGTLSGNIIFIDGNILHQYPSDQACCFLLIDPTSTIAEKIRRQYLNERPFSSLQSEFTRDLGNETSDENLLLRISSILRRLSLEAGSEQRMDPRIDSLLRDIAGYKYIGRKVADIATELNYSESWLTHLFKREAGIALKNYLIIRQLEYVWKGVLDGHSITRTALDAGFASPSHFSMTCKQMMGISLSDVMRDKADF